ncbi:ATP-binding protein [Sphingomonas prati]|uniref:ATP-binding protein n=1 Tax=Sphingomonas prati TaxID=1843237 RepID=A0A7W9F475_9SPHN|nr:ATP-binding protein [Sphingomonas prati]MBB5730624.1 hypothetical protein [Sphingomonas prati]GGE95512.1 ATPase [Sphingomonas prati]
MNFRNAPPRAAALVESLRGLGYSTATAIADIIDNSIAAGAGVVDVRFHWAGAGSWITILDDGRGMDPVELDSAMRLGDRNPLDERAAGDLGRFGLGLKTASFSQGRSLTVASRTTNGTIDCLRWDLDVLASSTEWHLLEGPSEGSEFHLDVLRDHMSGTLVLLEKLDRLVTSEFEAQDFLDVIDRVEGHLGMTFHRYLEGRHPRLQLKLNGKLVQPWEPFLTGHAGKPWSPAALRLGADREIEVQCHVLPHRDKLSPREYEEAAGPEGWTLGQGFYVYRNERLLVAGGWLGLGTGRRWTRDEAHRLARIRIDIPNSADSDWKLDIRKSAARPPVGVRKRLTRLAEETRHRARRVFAHRGRTTPAVRGEPVEMAWLSTNTATGTRYRISRTHQGVLNMLEQHPELAPDIEAMLRCIEETVPVQRIWLDTAEQKDTPLSGFAHQSDAEVCGVLEAMFRSLVLKKGLTAEEARIRLARTEPFDRFPDLVSSLPDVPISPGA